LLPELTKLTIFGIDSSFGDGKGVA
jgi:hypothetical protein